MHQISEVFVEVERITHQQLVWYLKANIVGQVALHLGRQVSKYEIGTQVPQLTLPIRKVGLGT